MSLAPSASKHPAKLGEDQPMGNLPKSKSSSHAVYIDVRLSRLESHIVEIPIESFLTETIADQPTDFISDDDARVIVRSAVNEAAKTILDTADSAIYDDLAKTSINDYLEMCIQGTNHLRGMYYEIRSQAKPLCVSVGYFRIANTLVTRAVGNNIGQDTMFHFDFTKAVSHPDDREIFAMYRGTAKDDGEQSSLSTPRYTFGGSMSVLSDVESIMVMDDADPKGTRVLTSLERKLDSALKATKLSFLGVPKMPKNIDVVVEDVNEDDDASGRSVNSILPPITEPTNRRRYGSLFPDAVARAIAGAADGMTSAFSKGPPPSIFSKGPIADDKVNYGKKIRDMHSPSDPNTPVDSPNFASR